jgi:2-polyprenyl-3-methyl-5-hydroxy-6-metoxy-1,4-benzoquinol methylase
MTNDAVGIMTAKPMTLFSKITSLFQRKVLRTDRSRWNHQYERGQWDGLEALDELARFSVIAGLVPFLKPGAPHILEVGCGEGVLAQRVGRDQYGFYLGTDVADAAIREANRRFGDESTDFQAIDMNNFQTDRTFDLIIFNEAAYYLRPLLGKLTDHYGAMLNPDGLLIVSLNNGPHADSAAKWTEIEQAFTVLDDTLVETRKNSWRIKVLKPM